MTNNDISKRKLVVKLFILWISVTFSFSEKNYRCGEILKYAKGTTM